MEVAAGVMSVVSRVLFKIGPKRTIHGVRCAVALFADGTQGAAAFARLLAAFDLIQKHAPVRYAQVTRDVARVLVSGAPWARGSFCPASRICELDFEWVIDTSTPPEAVAATLIHEAQHARLHRLGFDYTPEIRPRIERLCHRSARNFARRVGDGQWLVDQLNRQLDRDPHVYSPAGRWEAKAEALAAISLPQWIKSPMGRYLAWRAKRSGGIPAASGRPTKRCS